MRLHLVTMRTMEKMWTTAMSSMDTHMIRMRIMGNITTLLMKTHLLKPATNTRDITLTMPATWRMPDTSMMRARSRVAGWMCIFIYIWIDLQPDTLHMENMADTQLVVIVTRMHMPAVRLSEQADTMTLQDISTSGKIGWMETAMSRLVSKLLEDQPAQDMNFMYSSSETRLTSVSI